MRKCSAIDIKNGTMFRFQSSFRLRVSKAEYLRLSYLGLFTPGSWPDETVGAIAIDYFGWPAVLGCRPFELVEELTSRDEMEWLSPKQKRCLSGFREWIYITESYTARDWATTKVPSIVSLLEMAYSEE